MAVQKPKAPAKPKTAPATKPAAKKVTEEVKAPAKPKAAKPTVKKPAAKPVAKKPAAKPAAKPAKPKASENAKNVGEIAQALGKDKVAVPRRVGKKPTTPVKGNLAVPRSPNKPTQVKLTKTTKPATAEKPATPIEPKVSDKARLAIVDGRVVEVIEIDSKENTMLANLVESSDFIIEDTATAKSYSVTAKGKSPFDPLTIIKGVAKHYSLDITKCIVREQIGNAKITYEFS